MGVVVSPEALRRASVHMQAAVEAMGAELVRMTEASLGLVQNAEWVGAGAEAFAEAWQKVIDGFAKLEQREQKMAEILNTFARQIDEAAAPVVGIAAELGLPFVIGETFHFDALRVPFPVIEDRFKDSLAAARIAALLNEAVDRAEWADRAAAGALAGVVGVGIRAAGDAAIPGALVTTGLQGGNSLRKLYTLWQKFKEGAAVPLKYRLRLTHSADGRYWIVKGKKRTFQINGDDAWSQFERQWFEENWLPGTRYRTDNVKALAIAEKHGGNFSRVADELDGALNVFKKENWAKAVKGGGVLGLALGVGADVYDYGFGERAETGLWSADFGAAATTEVVKTGVETAAATALGEVVSASLTFATAGSVFPGVGTLVGVAVGVGFIVFDNTPAGKHLWSSVKGGIKDAFQWAGKEIQRLGAGLQQTNMSHPGRGTGVASPGGG